MIGYRLLYILVFTFLPLIGFSQEKNWTFSILYYPHISIPMEEGIEFEGRLLSEFEAKFSNSIGVRISKKINDKWKANLELNYLNIGYREIEDSLHFNLTIDPITGEFNGTIASGVFMRNLNFIEIPLGISRVLKQNEKGSLYINLGFNSKYYLYGRTIVKVKYEEDEREEVNRGESYLDEYLSRINFGFRSSIGYSHNLTKSISYFVEPLIQFDLIGNNPPAKSKLIDYISIGILFGVTI